MSLYELEPRDLENIRELVHADSLAIKAPHAQALAALQRKLVELRPSDALEVHAKAMAALVGERDEARKELEVQRANYETLLERWKEVSAELDALKSSAKQVVATRTDHSEYRGALECDAGTCTCPAFKSST